MNKKIKTILSLGAATMITASSMLPINALSNKEYAKCTTKTNVYICINGVKYKLPLKPNCPSIPSTPEVTPETKPDTTPEQKPEVTPETKPDTTPEQKPEVTPETKPDTTPEQKPEVTPETKPDTTPEVDSSTNFSAYQQEVLNLVNVERTNRGLSPLTLDSKLSNVATIKSQDMASKNYFSHTSPTYGSPFDMMSQFGISYKSAGENIAMGQKTPKEVVNAWMNSQGHRENILSSSFTNLGVGTAKNSNGSIYWTQMFISK